jgi:hypothetical protein
VVRGAVLAIISASSVPWCSYNRYLHHICVDHSIELEVSCKQKGWRRTSPTGDNQTNKQAGNSAPRRRESETKAKPRRRQRRAQRRRRRSKSTRAPSRYGTPDSHPCFSPSALCPTSYPPPPPDASRSRSFPLCSVDSLLPPTDSRCRFPQRLPPPFAIAARANKGGGEVKGDWASLLA